MKIVKTASGKQSIKISKKEWEAIGRNAGWMKISAKAPSVYLLDQGILYDEDGDEVFNMKKLIKYFNPMKEMGIKSIPTFKNAEEANAFLENMEDITGDRFGRVDSVDLMKKLRYKDTKEERFREKNKMIDEKNRQMNKNLRSEDFEELKLKKEILKDLDEREERARNLARNAAKGKTHKVVEKKQKNAPLKIDIDELMKNRKMPEDLHSQLMNSKSKVEPTERDKQKSRTGKDQQREKNKLREYTKR